METIRFLFFLRNFIVHIPLSLVTSISHDSQQAHLLVKEDTLLTMQIKFWCHRQETLHYIQNLFHSKLTVKKNCKFDFAISLFFYSCTAKDLSNNSEKPALLTPSISN